MYPVSNRDPINVFQVLRKTTTVIIIIILSGLATSNEGDAYGLLFTASPRELIINKFRIYNILWRKPCQLSGWMQQLYLSIRQKQSKSSVTIIKSHCSLISIHKQIYAFIVKHIFYSNQSGFRSEYSIIDTILTFACDVLCGINNTASCLSVYLDLFKAFDTINRDILRKKLNQYNLHGSNTSL